MSDIKKDSTTSPQQPANKPTSDDSASWKQLDEDANEMAGKASKTENRYDEDHDIFTK